MAVLWFDPEREFEGVTRNSVWWTKFLGAPKPLSEVRLGKAY